MTNNIRNTVNIPKSCLETYLPLVHPASIQMVDLGIHFSGISYLKSRYRVGQVDSSSHMVIATFGGEGYFTTHSQELALIPGTILSVPHGTGWLFGAKKNRWDILWFYMKPERQWEFLKSRGVSLERSFSIGKMKRAMEGFLDECAGNSNSRNGDAIKYSELILSSLFQSLNHNPLSEEQTQKQELEELWRNVGSNVGHKWSVRLLAERISMSESSFKRAVVSHFETTPWEIVVRLRMETAQQLLKHSHYPLKIIAERTGYADPFIFSTAFKKFTGQTPRDFRKSGALAPYS